MEIFIYFTASLLIISKFFDCYSTHKRIGGNPENEINPFASKMMRKDINTTIWLFFLIAVLLVSFSTWILVRFYPEPVYEITFIIVGISITVIQLAVAHNNYYGRPNFVTQIVKNVYKNSIF